MQQRVGLARALSTDPDVLLMDEPFAALDAQTREILQEEMLHILERAGKTIVFVTHSIDEAILLGDRVIVMTARPGRLKQIIPVPYPRPRNLSAMRADPAIGALRTHVWDLLRQEILAPPAR
jgi:NitT/TauT family transport system ATP-binding protein